MFLGHLPRLLLAIVALLLLHRIVNRAYHRYLHQRKAKELGCEPAPLERTRWFFGIDMLLKLLESDRQQRTPDFMVERYNAMGPRYTWRTQILGTEHYTTAEPRNVQAILATQFQDFIMGKARRSNLKSVLGRSIFAVDGQAWHSAREILRPVFSREQVSDLTLLEHHFQRMLQCMPIQEDCWTEPVSLASLFPGLTLDSATELFLGKSSESLLVRIQGKEHGKDFHWAFERVQQLLGTRLRFRNLYWLYGSRELRECVAILHRFCAQAISESESRNKSQSQKYDFLDVLMSRCSDRVEVREHVLGLLAAGRDTTASLMSWTFYCLVRNPRVFNKLRDAILDTFGPHCEEQTNAITFERLKGCSYLQHVMNETLRLHSIVPFNSRCAARDTTLPTGGGIDGTAPVFIPEGTEVNFSTHVMHRRYDVWGADADEFVPERWEKRRPGWAYAPFNGGPRLCIGQQYALTETGYVIARMLQRFDKIEGLDIDPNRDWHNFTVVCAPGSQVDRHQSVKVRLRAARG